MNAATFIKDLPDFTGSAKLWKLARPISYEDGNKKCKAGFVVTSATMAMFSGPETYIFPADAKGNVLSWSELSGSYRGDLDHETAIEGAGWTIKRKTKAVA